MKIHLVKASSGGNYSRYKAETGGPPQNIFSAAAATPKEHQIVMNDETIGQKATVHRDVKLVVIFMSTPDAYRAYDLAKKYKKNGSLVILGGLHTTFNQEEASQYSDSIILGEVENYWDELLFDAQTGCLKEVYNSPDPVDLSLVNPYPLDLIPPREYNYAWSVLVSRGCPYKCSFCVVHKFFNKFKLRPIENIVSELKELKEHGVEWIELHSDNLTQNKKYALELFEAIAPLKLKFYGETTVLIGRDEELLLAAKKAGVKAFLLGIETPSEEALKAQNKTFVKPALMKEYISNIQKCGIEVWGDFLFGFDEHTPTIFEETLTFIKSLKVDKVIPHFVIPFPGSETFKKLESEGRILTHDWSQYDGTHVVYKPKMLSAEELEEGTYWVWERTASFKDRVLNFFT